MTLRLPLVTAEARRARHERDPACWAWRVPAGDLDPDPWTALDDWQAGRCGLCGNDVGTEILDHDHHSALARGWICRGCNIKEGGADGLTDMYARWRACPATAVLGVRFVYVSWFPTAGGGAMHDKWTGFTYLPDWAPDAHGWPHAMTCSVSAIQCLDNRLERPCGHDHVGMVARALDSVAEVED